MFYIYFKLYLKFNGPNNSTNVGFTGSSRHAREAQVVGNAKISTGASVSGTSAVDFDGTLCEFAFPKIGEQNKSHKKLMNQLIKLRAHTGTFY